MAVWCTMSSRRIVGPIFVYGTETIDQYVKVLGKWFHSHYPKGLRFRHDVIHARRILTLLKQENDVPKEHFGDRIFPLVYPKITGMRLTWPWYFPYLKHMWLTLCDYIKGNMKLNNLKTTAELYIVIQEAIDSIDVPTFWRVM